MDTDSVVNATTSSMDESTASVWMVEKSPTKKASARKSGAKKNKKAKSSTEVKRKKKRSQSFSCYIYKVSGQVHPGLTVTNKAMAIMNSFVWDTFDKLCKEAISLTTINNKQTLTSRDIHTAVTLSIPGELARHAVSEGVKAVTKYNESRDSQKEDKKRGKKVA